MDSNELLCTTVKTDRYDITKILLGSGADPNYIDKAGKSPLLYACKNKMVQQIKLLISHGADVNKHINQVCCNVVLDLEIVKLFLDTGADPNVILPDGENILTKFVIANNIEAVALLLSYASTNVNLPNVRDVTALRIACATGKSAIAKLLLNNGANPNIINKVDKSTPFIRATELAYPDLICSMLSYNVMLDMQDAIGNTALHYACTRNLPIVVSELLNLGANQTIKNIDGRIAAEMSPSSELRWIFKNYGQLGNKKVSTQADDKKVPVCVDDLTNKKEVVVVPNDKNVFRVPNAIKESGAIVKRGNGCGLYRTWDKLFNCWSVLQKMPKDVVDCEYVDGKISHHEILDEDENLICVRFEYIRIDKGSMIWDIYE
uniref:Uncharacterized protein n=1 Tax=viral metagenome TaxID=1070528 RepID=A0A6C0C7J5_9ZZZZ